MASRPHVDPDWQVGKSLSECTGHMLEQQEACDVWFELPVTMEKNQGTQDDPETSGTPNLLEPPRKQRKMSNTLAEELPAGLIQTAGDSPGLDYKNGSVDGDTNEVENKINRGICEVGGSSMTTFSDKVSETMGAHRFILVSRSPVFRAMLEKRWRGDGGCTENTKSPIRLDDIAADAFGEFLKYLYTDTCKVTVGNVDELMYAASKYLVSQFYMSRCFREFLDTKLSVNNVCTILNNAVRYDVSDVINACVWFVAKDAATIFKSVDVLSLSRDALGHVLDSPALVVEGDECDVYRAVIRWAEHQRGKAKGTTLREAIGELLFKIRLSTLTTERCIDLINGSDMFSPQEKVDLFSYLGSRKSRENSSIPNLYPTTRRVYQGNNVDRSIASYQMDPLAGRSTTDILQFTVDAPVLLVKVGIHPNKSNYYAKGTLSVLTNDGLEITTASIELPVNANIWVRPVKLHEDTNYVLRARWSDPRKVLPSTNIYPRQPAENLNFGSPAFGGRAAQPAAPFNFGCSVAVAEPKPADHHELDIYRTKFNFNIDNNHLESSADRNRKVFSAIHYISLKCNDASSVNLAPESYSD